MDRRPPCKENISIRSFRLAAPKGAHQERHQSSDQTTLEHYRGQSDSGRRISADRIWQAFIDGELLSCNTLNERRSVYEDGSTDPEYTG